jgi:hypothetical protein
MLCADFLALFLPLFTERQNKKKKKTGKVIYIAFHGFNVRQQFFAKKKYAVLMGNN